MRRQVWVAAMAALCLGMGTGCGGEQAAQKAARPVKTHRVQPFATQPRMRYSANIEPREQVALAFKVNGYVSEVRQVRGADGKMRNLQEGDRVTRGMVLARIREDDYRESVNRSKASLAQAEAGLQKYTADYERAKRLFASDSLTKPDYDSATAAYEAAVAQTAGSRAALSEAELRLRDTALVAPLNGVVLSRNIEAGSLAGAGTVGFVVADTFSVKAMFGVPDTLMRRARLGATLPVTTETYGAREFPGRITAISPAADKSSRVFQVELSIPNPQNLLRAGMIATVEVPDEAPAAKEPVLVVPLAAIVKPPSGDHFSVFVVEAGSKGTVARLRPVEVGDVYGNMVAVRKGVAENDQVVVTGASLLADNDLVQIIP